LDATVTSNFNIDVSRYAAVDYEDMIDIIDALGGIEIYWTSKEIEIADGYIRDMCNTLGIDAWDHLLPVEGEGNWHCDGIQAVAYARNRFVGNSDYERTARQRRAMSSIYTRLKDTVSVSFILDLIDEIFPQIRTNMSNGQIMSLAMTVYAMNADGIEQYRIPADGAFTPMYVRGMAVLVPDLDACRRYLQEILYSE
jgi:anionic cell wall polymer biosynthesis LytR-Cps2A-Psr (LCP) family protein